MRQRAWPAKAAGFDKPGSAELSELVKNLFSRRSHPIVGFGELPAHDAALVDHVSRGMGPAPAVGVEKTVTVDHFVIAVLQQRKVDSLRGDRAQAFGEFSRIRVAVRADRQDLRFFALSLIQQILQLAELRDTEGSPMAAIEHQHDVFFAMKIR